jgi:hypothetical protein
MVVGSAKHGGAMAVQRTENFSNTTVDLDDYVWEDCTFTDCVLRYSGVGMSILSNTNLEGCRMELTGPALRTVQYMRELYHSGGQEVVEAWFDQIRQPPEA